MCHLYANFARKNRQNLIGQRQHTCSRIATPIISTQITSRQKWELWDQCASRNRKHFINKSFKLRGKQAKFWRHIEYQRSRHARSRHCARTDSRTYGTWKWINIWKFYIKKWCKYGLRGNNCNYPHPAICKKYIENPEKGCRERTNYHLDICKYSRKLRKSYNVNWYRIHHKGTIRKRSPQVQQHALSRKQKQTSFITPPALQTLPLKTNLTKPPIPLTLITLPAPISSYTYSQNQILPYSHSLTSSYPHPNFQQPSSPRHNLSRQHTAVHSPSDPPQCYHQKEQTIAKIEPNTDDKFYFFIRKNNEPVA